MSLSKFIRQFRKERAISQEYMAEKLHMSQPTYHRLEQRDAECAKRLCQIAHALDTTPELLRECHLAKDSHAETYATLDEQLAEKEDEIRSQADYIQFLNHFIDYTQTVLRTCLTH